MRVDKKNEKFFFFIIFFIILVIFFYFTIKKTQKEKKLALEPITINLLTSVHPNLPWNFKPTKSEIIVKPGEVIIVEYIVENLGTTSNTGIATFSYFPNQIGTYISKINCFCYDVQTLKPGEQDKYTLVFFIDPEVTKDSKTNNVKEITIQFIFFDYKEYKKSGS